MEAVLPRCFLLRKTWSFVWSKIQRAHFGSFLFTGCPYKSLRFWCFSHSSIPERTRLPLAMAAINSTRSNRSSKRKSMRQKQCRGKTIYDDTAFGASLSFLEQVQKQRQLLGRHYSWSVACLGLLIGILKVSYRLNTRPNATFQAADCRGKPPRTEKASKSLWKTG